MECEPLKKVTLTEQIMEQIAGMITSGPVSYTHLDVYKRQPFFP